MMSGIILWMSSGCSGTKSLSSEKTLYTGANVKLDVDGNVNGRKGIKRKLEDLVRPKPNLSILGLRPRLWLHNKIKEPDKDKGLRHWLKYKIGHPPVLLSDVRPELVQQSLNEKLFNLGFFTSEVEYEINQKDKTSKIIYQAFLSDSYKIRKIINPEDTSKITSIIDSVRNKSVLNENERFNLEILDEERKRIQNVLKDEGYYYFSSNDLIFDIDSAVGDRQLDIYLSLKEDVSLQALEQYHINNINIYPDYSFAQFNNPDTTVPVKIDSMNYFNDSQDINPEAITKAVLLKPKHIYSRELHTKTLNRLIGLGIFKYVDIRFQEDSAANLLNANVLLSPLKKKSIRLQVEMVSKSNNFLGPGIDLTYTNRNIFGGAELFNLSLQSSFETQVSGQQNKSLNSLEMGLEASLTIPRFLTPFNFNNEYRFVPKTKLSLGGSFMDRVDYFRLHSTNFTYSFLWKESLIQNHAFTPVDINYVSVTDEGPKFKEFLQNNPFVANNYQDQFIVGGGYSYTYNSKLKENSKLRTNNFYFNANLNVAGNLFYLTQSGANGFENNEQQEPYKIFGSPYAQFTKGLLDFRHYYRFNKRNHIASKLIVGIGMPYGNSVILPYIKQFSAGGSNSIRAFRARTVGPGTYYNDSINNLDVYIDQTGDIKLEGSLEYRFNLWKEFLKGAIFTDVGNIWLVNEDSTRTGGKFHTDQFLDQISVGTGVGLRVVTKFFVLRLDVAFPIRKVVPIHPEEPNGMGRFEWVFDHIDFADTNWRRDNLVWNLAIGYPF
jgi:outer membrane protein assembly factor BamA